MEKALAITITLTAMAIAVKVVKNKKSYVESKYKPIKSNTVISSKGIKTSI